MPQGRRRNVKVGALFLSQMQSQAGFSVYPSSFPFGESVCHPALREIMAVKKRHLTPKPTNIARK